MPTVCTKRPRPIHAHNFMKMHTVHPQMSPTYSNPQTRPFPTSPSGSAHHPYPTGSLRRATGQADGREGCWRRRVVPKTFHLPLGSLGSLGRKSGQVWLRGEGPPWIPPWPPLLPCTWGQLGRGRSEDLGSSLQIWAPELALGSPAVFGTPGGAKMFPLH